MALVRAQRLHTAAAVRELDRRAIEDRGVAGYALMTRAAATALQCLRLRWPGARRLAVYCGGGNNGGDGLVLSRMARAAGLEVELGLAGDPERLRGAAAQAWQDLEGPSGGIEAVDPSAADVIVDALLGTGLDRPVEGAMAAAIEAINAAGRPVLAIDIPSGLQADTGAVLGSAVHADLTTQFIGAKRGLYTGSGIAYAGTVLLDDLDVPADIHRPDDEAIELLDHCRFPATLPGRMPTAHKGDAGHVLVIGGSPGFGGAARLTGEAALRSGAGLVSLATWPAHVAALVGDCPAVMAHGVEDAAALQPLLERADVVAIGPGLGRGDWGRDLLQAVLEQGPRRLVIDADGLNLLAESPRTLPGESLITPHPGEAARLLECEVEAIQADRFAAASALCERFGCSVLLKGPGTVITGREADTAVVATAEPALAVGGSGDVLTGIVAGLRAQGADGIVAARSGALSLLAAAGRAAQCRGTRGVLPTDLVGELGRVLAAAERD